MVEEKKIPQIRFRDFTQEWCKNQLSCYLETSKDKNTNNMFSKNDVFSVSGDHGVVNQIEFQGKSFAGVSVKNYGVVRNGDVVYTKSPLKNEPYGIIKTNKGKDGIVSALYAVYHPLDAVCSPFVETYFNLDRRLNNYLRILISKGAKNTINISDDDVLLGTVCFPEKAEQERIADGISILEQMIFQSEERIGKLRNLQTSLLASMFPENNEEIPKIRLRGFVKKWGRFELSAIATKVIEKNTQNEISETFTNSAEHGVISQRDFFDHDISKADKINGYYIIKSNDFVYNPRVSVTAPCGPINCNRLGRSGVMSPLYTVFRTHDVDTLYLEWYFKSPHWHSYMRYNGDSGARSDRFSIKNELFFKMPIPIPEIEEQLKIGQILQNLNNVIKLSQNELKKLQSLKKALLEKMFV